MNILVCFAIALLTCAPLFAQPCDPTPSVTLTYWGESQCITVCEGSETTLKVPLCPGCTPCDVVYVSYIGVMNYDPNMQCSGPFDGWATLDRLAWSLTDADTFVNTIHGVQNGNVVVYFESLIYWPPLIQYDPANGFPQSMCVLIEYTAFAHPCFGPFPPGQVPRITEHPGCNASNNCSGYNYNDPPDYYESNLDAYSNLGVYIWNAIEYGDWGGHVCVSMEGLLNPDPPANLTIRAAGENHVLLQWTHSGADSFHVLSSNDPDGPFALLGTAFTNQFVDSVAESARFYSVTAFVGGNESPPSPNRFLPRGQSDLGSVSSPDRR